MTQYTITVSDYESGLTEEAIRSQFEDNFPSCEIEVEEQ